MNRFPKSVAAAAAACFIAISAPAPAVPITVNYLDEAGVGFNDPVLGQVRRSAFEITMWAFSNTLQGNIPITVDTYFVYGVGAEWGYGDGWPNSFVRDFNGVPGGVYYPVSLANQLVNADYTTDSADITVIFNGDMDVSGGVYGEKWYYGWDGIAGSNVDFITEAAHGFMRGLGFYTLMNPNDGEYYVLTGDTAGYPDIFTSNLAFVWGEYNINITQIPANLRKLVMTSENALHWVGPALTQASGFYPTMYCPSVPAGETAPYGVADHFHPDYGQYQLMWPWYVAPCHDLSSARWALMDIGWTLY